MADEEVDEEEDEEDEEEEYKKMFFKSAENFRYGKASKLNMLAFRKKIKHSYGYENSFENPKTWPNFTRFLKIDRKTR